MRLEVALEYHLGFLPRHITYYNRFLSIGILWHSEAYSMPKRVKSVAQLQDDSAGIIQALATFDGSPAQQHPQYLVLIEKLHFA